MPLLGWPTHSTRLSHTPIPPPPITLQRNKEQVFNPTIHGLFGPQIWDLISRTLLLSLPCLHMAEEPFCLFVILSILMSILTLFGYSQKSPRQTFLTPLRWPLYFHVGLGVQTTPPAISRSMVVVIMRESTFMVFIDSKAKAHPSADLLYALILLLFLVHVHSCTLVHVLSWNMSIFGLKITIYLRNNSDVHFFLPSSFQYLTTMGPHYRLPKHLQQ